MNTLHVAVDDAALVAELNARGVHFIAGDTHTLEPQLLPEELICGLTKSHSPRIRLALIPLLLLRPQLSLYLRDAVNQFDDDFAAITLKCFSTAACILQKKYNTQLQPIAGAILQDIRDDFSGELGVCVYTQCDLALNALAARQAQLTQLDLNWRETYDQAAQHVLRRYKREATWQI